MTDDAQASWNMRRLDDAEAAATEGRAVDAARILRRVREQVKREGDDPAARLAIDASADECRARLSEGDRGRFNEYLENDGLLDAEPEIDVSPVGMWLAVAGAAAMVIAIFLPRVEATSFSSIRENTLVQSGDGWAFVCLALIGVGSVFRAYKTQRRTWGPLIAGALGIVAAIYDGTNHDALQICSVAPATFGQNCEQAAPGIGIYMAGLGGLLMLVGGWQIRTSKPPAESDKETPVGDEPQLVADPPPTKTCPDCAETVLAAARVCKHCGLRFEPASAEG